MIDFAGKLPLYLGNVYATPRALNALSAAKVRHIELLVRHSSGDWGDVSTEQAEANNRAVVNYGRVLSCYLLPTGVVVEVSTEGDRSQTTLMVAADYLL